MDNPVTITLLAGKVIGAFLVIWALFLITRRRECMDMVDKLRGNPTVLYVIAIIILPIGLSLVIIHPVWVMGWPVIITLTGWALIFSSLIYLFFPHKAISQFMGYLNKPSSYIIHSITSLVIGIYLLFMSFGL